MLVRLTMIAAVALTSCSTTAPHTFGAAAINTALATGVAAGSLAAGGCIATCTNGTTCNSRTGMCDRTAEAIWVATPGPEANRLTLQLQQQANPTVQGTPAILGISPATGSVPPPPAESSPRRP